MHGVFSMQQVFGARLTANGYLFAKVDAVTLDWRSTYGVVSQRMAGV
jgi:hypothetical protein